MKPNTPTLDAYRFEVLADRLSLRERIEQGGERSKRDVLTHVLLSRHPEIGDRIAREITTEVCDRWKDCLEGLEDLAEGLLELRGGEIFLRSDIPLRQPRSLLDEDQLMAAKVASFRHERGGGYVPVDPWLLFDDPIPPALPRDLEDLLERPLAETHIHLGGAAPPITFWLPLVLGLISMETAGKMAATGSAQEARETRDRRELTNLWIRRLLEAAVLRFYLAARLRKLFDDHPFRWIAGLEDVPWMPDEEPLPAKSSEVMILPWVQAFRRILDAVGHRTPDDPAAGPPLPGCPIWVHPKGEIPYRDCLTQAVETELGLRAPSEAPALGERYLLASALRYVRSSEGRGDDVFRKRLLRYVRIKHALLRLLVHHGGIHGLDRFSSRQKRFASGVRRYDPNRVREVWYRASVRYQVRATVIRWLEAGTRQRLLPHVPAATRSTHQVRALLQEAALRLERRLELRTSPYRGRRHSLTLLAMAEGVRDALQALRRPDFQESTPETPLPRLQLGLVLHLHKGKKTSAAAYDEMLKGVLLWLEDHPEWQPFILGADVAGIELDSPPSRFALAYDGLTRWRAEVGPRGLGMPSHLGKTFHVGEDFRDLLTGIRHVDMAIDLLELQPGDRLGHALAVGFDVERWYQRRGRSFPRLGDHLLDLLWARGMLIENCSQDTTCRAVVESRLHQRGVKEPERLAKRFNEWCEKLRAHDPDAESEEELQKALVREIDRQASAERLTEVEADADWIGVLRLLQTTVVRKIDQEGLFIEANPTSNLVISGLNDFTELPLFHLHPIRLETDGEKPPPLRLSISTDDPEVFRVNLREEYAALFDAALATERYGRREILEWLDRLRSDGYESSFMDRSSLSGEELLKYLELITLAESQGP